jgi:hypothetical protein
LSHCNHEELIKSASKFTCWQCGKKFYRVTPAIYETSDRPRYRLLLVRGTLTNDVTSQTWERVPNEPGHWRDPLADMAERIEEFGRGSHQQEMKFNPGDPRAIKFQKEHIVAVRRTSPTLKIFTAKGEVTHPGVILAHGLSLREFGDDGSRGWINKKTGKWVTREEAEQLSGANESYNLRSLVKFGDFKHYDEVDFVDNPSFRPGDIVDVMDDNGEYQFGGRIISRLPKDRYLLINGQVVREVDLQQHRVEFFGRGMAINPGDPRAIKFQKEHVPAIKLDTGRIVVGKKHDLHGNIITRLADNERPYVVETGFYNINTRKWVSRNKAEKLCGHRECVTIEGESRGVRNVREYGKTWNKIYDEMVDNPRFSPADLFFFDAELDFLVKFGLVIPRVPGTLVETDHGIYRLRVYDEEKVGWYVDCVKCKQGSFRS